MDQSTVDAAELVAEFDGLRHEVLGPLRFVVRWHEPSRRFIVVLSPYFVGTGEPNGLRRMAEAILRDAHRRDGFTVESEVAYNGHSIVDTSVSCTSSDDTHSLSLCILIDPEDFEVADHHGQSRYTLWSGQPLEFTTHPIWEASQLPFAARALLDALDAHAEVAHRQALPDKTVAKFHRPRSGPMPELQLAILGNDYSTGWAVRIPGVLTVSAEPERILSFAEGLRHTARTSNQVSCLLAARDRLYQMHATIGPIPDESAYLLEVRVVSPSGDGGQHILSLIGGGRFNTLGRAQLETAAANILNWGT